MVVEIKDYGTIGYPRLLNLKVMKIAYDDLVKEEYEKAIEIYSGKSEELPEEISRYHYYKIQLGNPTVYYIISEQ